MSKERECATKLRAIVGKEPFQTFVAKVTKVDGATCTVQRLFDDMELEEVRLNCHSTENEGVVIVPETGSMVLITSIDGRCWFVSQCSKVEKITIDANDKIIFNGGNNNGLVKIEELKRNLNSLKNYVEAMASAVSTAFSAVGVGTAASGPNGQTVFITDMELRSINFEDMEDTKITH